jgi:hypothetical protein
MLQWSVEVAWLAHTAFPCVPRAMDNPAMSWRVGVKSLKGGAGARPRLSGLQPAGSLDLTRAAVPAVMQVNVLDVPSADGAAVILDLFRTELLVGVVEVTREGIITNAGTDPLNRPGAPSNVYPGACTSSRSMHVLWKVEATLLTGSCMLLTWTRATGDI